MALPPIVVELQAKAGELVAGLGEAKAAIADVGNTGSSAMSKMGTVASTVGPIVGAAILAIGVEAVHLGSQLDDAQASLKAAMTAAGQSFKDYQPQIDAVQKHMESLGFTYAQTDSALARSVVSTQNMGKSLSLMGLAADLARLKHIDLASATDILDKAMVGNLRPLKQLAIDLPVTATNALKLQQADTAVKVAQEGVNAVLQKYPDAANAASKGHAAYEAAAIKVWNAQQKLNAETSASKEIFDALTQRLGGQAAAAADTFGGRLDVLRARGEDLLATLGQRIIPILDQLLGWMTKNTGVVELLAAVVGGVLVAAFVAWTAAMLGALAPFVAIGAAIVALGAGLDWLYNHVTWFRDVVNAVWTFIKDYWLQIVTVIIAGPFGLLIAGLETLYQKVGWFRDFVNSAWNDIKGFISDAWAVIKVIWDAIVAAINVQIDVDKTLMGVAQTLWNAVSTVVTTMWGVVKPILDLLWNTYTTGITTAWNTLSTVASVVWSAVSSAISAAWSIIQVPLNALKQVIQDIIQGFRDIISTAQNVGSAISGALSHIPGSGIVKSITGILGFAEGGMVPGPIGAPQLAIVHGGETITPVGRQGGGGQSIYITVQGDIYGDASPVFDQLQQQLNAYMGAA